MYLTIPLVYNLIMKSYYVLFKGQVQGVGFRYIVATRAQTLGINGDVKNLMNGDVECHFEGENQKILSLIRYMCSNQGFIIVEDYFMKEVALKNYTTFKVLY